jgi:precorrin-2 methylase
MIIEILDALRHLPVTPGVNATQTVVAAFDNPKAAGPSALSVLPTAHSRQDEEDMLLVLADAYNKGHH